MALPLETVPINTLCPPTDLDALACSEGFTQVVEATAPAAARPFWLLRDRGWEKVSAAPAGLAPPLGLNFVRDLTLCGSGYVFSDGRFSSGRRRTPPRWRCNGCRMTPSPTIRATSRISATCGSASRA